MKLVIISVLIIGTLGAPGSQSLSVNEDGTYQFSYETGQEGGNHFRTESKGQDGIVIGKYSYNDPTGGIRVVSYRADDTGFAVNEDGEVPKPSASESEQHETPALKEAAKPEDSENEKPKEETTSTTDTPAQDEDKPQKSEEPILELEKVKSEDLPPEGFPLGFFSEQFSALRRLPEPSKDEKETKQKDEGETDESTSDATASEGPKGLFSTIWKPEALPPEAFPPDFFLQHFTGLRRLGEPVKKPEWAQSPEMTKLNSPESVDEATTQGKVPMKGFHSGYIMPFPSYIPHPWPAASHHHPAYVYSYQQPNAYTYGYYY